MKEPVIGRISDFPEGRYKLFIFTRKAFTDKSRNRAIIKFEGEILSKGTQKNFIVFDQETGKKISFGSGTIVFKDDYEMFSFLSGKLDNLMNQLFGICVCSEGDFNFVDY